MSLIHLSCKRAGLNSEFSFFYNGCLTKTKELKMPYNLPRAGRVEGRDPCFSQEY